MSVKSNRIKNLQALVQEFGLTDIAEKARTSYDNLWQISNGTLLPSGLPRGVGDKLARKIEAGYGKPTGWMDRDPTMTPEALAVFEAFSRQPPERQKALAPIILAAIGPHYTDEEVEEKMPATKTMKVGDRRREE